MSYAHYNFKLPNPLPHADAYVKENSRILPFRAVIPRFIYGPRFTVKMHKRAQNEIRYLWPRFYFLLSVQVIPRDFFYIFCYVHPHHYIFNIFEGVIF